MLGWLKNAEAKTTSTEFTWLYFVFPNSFLFSYFNSNILYPVHLFGIRWSFTINLFSNDLFQTFDYFRKHVPTKSLFHCLDIFFIKFKDY